MFYKNKPFTIYTGLIITTIFLILLFDIPSYSKKSKSIPALKIEIPTETDYMADSSYDYSRVDRYAVSSSLTDEQSIDSLSKFLSKSGINERDKARAIYTWITNHIYYDMDALKTRNYPDQSASSVLKTRKSICEGMSNLYHELAVKMNLCDKKISGYAKGYGYRTGDRFTQTNHAWNSVMIDGKWRLIDVTWGCSSIGSKTGIETTANPGFWFFTKPEFMIYTHLPELSEWSLLNHNVTLNDFENMIYLEKSFFELGYDQSSLSVCTFIIKTTGPFTISLKGGSGEIAAELIHSSGRYLQQYNPFPYDDINSKKTNVLVLCKNNGDTADASVNIPDAGTYELKLFSVLRDKNKTSMMEILSYRVVVISDRITDSEDIAKPVMTYDEFEQLGFSVSGLSHKNYGIKTDHDIKLELNSSHVLDMLAIIEHDGSELKELTFTQKNNGKYIVNCTFPSDGIYNLRIFAMGKGSGDKYAGIAAYRFFVSGIVKRELCGFPLVFGDYEERDAKLISPLTGYLKKNSTVEFKIEVPDAVEVFISSGRNRSMLKKTTGNIFEGKVKITGDTISLGAKFKNGKGQPLLLKYKAY